MRSFKLKTAFAVTLCAAVAALLYSVVFVTTPAKASNSGISPNAVILSENFDNIATLPSAGWVEQNNSDIPYATWFQGNVEVFTSHSGNPDSYIGVNFESTDGSEISNWMMTPTLNMNNGDVIKFWTRTATGSQWPDRAEVRLSSNGASTNVGTTPTSLGDFTTLLYSINPSLQVGGYPEAWTEVTVTVSGLSGPTSGRIALRYYVTDGGPFGSASNYIGFDDFTYESTGGGPTPTPTATPTPTPTPTPVSYLYDNGPVKTGTVTGNGAQTAPSGFEWSESANNPERTNANSLYGVGCGASSSGIYRCADDFTVPAGQTWNITGVNVIAYQTGAASPNFTGGTLRIWNGPPDDPNSTVVFGDTATNRFVSKTAVGAYRIANTVVGTTAPGTTRPLWEISLSADTTLSAGTYWVDFSTTVTGNLTHFLPTVTIPNSRTQPGWNAKQYDPINGVWISIVDDGIQATIESLPQDMPFKLLGTSSGGPSSGSARADFDGDGKTDVSVFRPTEGVWYVNQSTDGFLGMHFGVASDELAPGDFDGDGKADIAVYRASNNPADYDMWILKSSDFTLAGGPWGVVGDVAVIGDYDGDGKDDVAVYRDSEAMWYISYAGLSYDMVQFGVTGDRPVAGDYDGDGKTDVAVFRNADNTWYIRQSSDSSIVSMNFGDAGDVLVPGDYDGDGKTDMATFRSSEGTWYIRNSSDASIRIETFGANGDVPAPGDYDGDGSEDVAIYRNGTWWINGSTSGLMVQAFGAAGDKPVPSADRP